MYRFLLLKSATKNTPYIYYIYIKTTIDNVIQFHPMLLPSKSIKINLSDHNEAYRVARSGIHNRSDKNKEAH